MTYYVSFSVDGVLTIPVNLDNGTPEQAEEIAKKEFDSYNFGELDVTDREIIRTENDSGDIY